MFLSDWRYALLNGPACDGMSETLVVSNVCGYLNQFATVPTTVLTNHAILSVYRHHPHSPGTISEDAVVDPREVKRSTLCNTSQCGELIYPWGECISGGNLIGEVEQGEGPSVWGCVSRREEGGEVRLVKGSSLHSCPSSSATASYSL